MKSSDVATSTYINFDVKNNDKNPQFSIHDHVGISKYKIVFAKVYTPNQLENAFAIKKKLKILDIFNE